MRRREFITLLGGAAAAWPLAARAQQPERMRTIGVLMTSAEDADGRARFTAFHKRLQDLGWTDGANLRLEVRWAAADMDRVRMHASEILALKPDAILATSGRFVRVLQQATKDVPVVFVGPADPVGAGFVKSMARPGGNITGFATLEPSIAGKWLEMLKEAAPQIARIGFIFSPDNPAGPAYRSLSEKAASALGVGLVAAAVRDADDIERAVSMIAGEPNGGLIFPLDLTISVHQELLAGLTARHRIPAISGYPAFAASGGLMSYGLDIADLYRRAASYVDRILKGEKPVDLPVQAPTKYDLVINLKTAKALGIDVPTSLLLRADEVIE